VEPALFLFAKIIASTDDPLKSTVRDRHTATIADLVPIAEHKLDLISDRIEVVYALETVAALEDLSIWQRELQGLADREVELECPACGDHVYLELVGDDIVATADPDDTRAGRAVRPARPADLAAPEARLLDLCHAHGHPTVAVELLHLFGMLTCPHCETEFNITNAIA
jgi:hypothetical protein